MHQNAAYAVQANPGGAKGYVTKSSPPEALVRAAFDVLQGRIAFSADIDHELALSRVASTPAVTDVLTPREFEILRMLLAERSTEDIGEILHLSPKRVANTRYLIKANLASPPTSSSSLWRFGREFWASRGIEEDAGGQ